MGVDEAEALRRVRPGACEKLWVDDLARALPWRRARAEPDHSADHINVKEIRSALNEARRMAADYPGSRFVELLDSRVAIGACAKGRSASKLLNYELPRAVPDFIAFDAYPGFLFVPTLLQPADGPPRGSSAVRTPTVACPPWASACHKAAQP